ncbi:hypothetical protein BFP70_03830 [Thioclava sp. SK-1]|uniref:hypothetical protein n=1 Tax=Thioclava sp. SK-1 TaxID=1889770 RepID=UPI000824FCBF|nr:hypothetical protein [Thioclava sp. SK-1]OCX66961.1 hypothetical protein BFP70_03830 [Thioclava sp. SK-1]
MTAYTSLPVVPSTAMTDLHVMARDTADETFDPAELISGAGALPEAPMAMPAQKIEQPQGRMRRMFSTLILQPARAPGRG